MQIIVKCPYYFCNKAGGKERKLNIMPCKDTVKSVINREVNHIGLNK